MNFDDMNAEQKPLSVEEIQSMAPEERKKKVGDMVDNYYAMDYEDMVSKARFALRTVLHADLMSRT